MTRETPQPLEGEVKSSDDHGTGMHNHAKKCSRNIDVQDKYNI